MRKILLLIILIFLELIAPAICYAEQESSWDKMVSECNVRVADDSVDEFYRIDVKKADLSFEANIQSFDVSKDRIVIVFSDGTMGIFNDKMQLINSFEYKPSDTLCGVMFHGDNIVLFQTRLDYATEITQNGGYVTLYDISNKYNETMEYAFKNTRRTEKTTCYMSYGGIPEDEMRSWDVPRLVRVDANGQKEIIYDALKYQIIRVIKGMILMILAIILAIVLFILYIRVYIPRNKERYGGSVYFPITPWFYYHLRSKMTEEEIKKCGDDKETHRWFDM